MLTESGSRFTDPPGGDPPGSGPPSGATVDVKSDIHPTGLIPQIAQIGLKESPAIAGLFPLAQASF
ncbi:hypothetical protein [Stutzerimonas xanthomarina]|uniref:hypothetical protein n=1 Tax=Stutzerimonas xanthomarina TaxID=271420 RepID=UPI003AA851AB